MNDQEYIYDIYKFNPIGRSPKQTSLKENFKKFDQVKWDI